MTMLTAEEAVANIVLSRDKKKAIALIKEIREHAASIVTLLQEDFEPGEEVDQVGNLVLDIELDAKNLTEAIKQLSKIEADTDKELEEIRQHMHRLGDVK